MSGVGKLIAVVGQLWVLIQVSAKFGIEAGLLTLAAILLNAMQLVFSEKE